MPAANPVARNMESGSIRTPVHMPGTLQSAPTAIPVHCRRSRVRRGAGPTEREARRRRKAALTA